MYYREIACNVDRPGSSFSERSRGHVVASAEDALGQWLKCSPNATVHHESEVVKYVHRAVRAIREWALEKEMIREVSRSNAGGAVGAPVYNVDSVLCHARLDPLYAEEVEKFVLPSDFPHARQLAGVLFQSFKTHEALSVVWVDHDE